MCWFCQVGETRFWHFCSLGLLSLQWHHMWYLGVGRGAATTLALVGGIVAHCASLDMLEQFPDYATNVNSGHKVPQLANLLIKNRNSNFLTSLSPLPKLVDISTANAPAITRHAQNGIWQRALALLQPKQHPEASLLLLGHPVLSNLGK